MFCAIPDDQINDFRARIYGKLFQMADKKQSLTNVEDFIKSIHKSLIEASKDEAGNPDMTWANTHIAFIPSTILGGYMSPKLLAVLPDNTKELKDLSSKFTDPDKGYDAITAYLAPKKLTPKEVSALVETDAFTPEEKDEDLDTDYIVELRSKLYSMETAAPTTALSSTGQDSTINEEGKFTNIADPEKNFNRGVRNKILKALRTTGDLSGSNLTFGGHTGFRLKAMKTNTLPGIDEGDFGQLLPSDSELLRRGGEMLLWDSKEKKYVKTKVTAEEYRTKYFDPGVVMTITDNDGNILYFDEDGNVTSKEEGRLVYIPFRKVNINKDGSLWTPSLASVNELIQRAAAEKLLTRKKGERLIRQGPDETQAAFTKRLIETYGLQEYAETLKKNQQEQLALVKKIRDYVAENPTETILLDITGGSLGYYDNTKATPLSKFDITSEDNIRPATETTVDKIEGRSYLTMPTVDVPIELRGMRIVDVDSGLLDNVSQVLARELYKNKQKMSAQDKVNYVTQFFYPGKGNQIFLRYNPSNESIEFSVQGKTIKFPDTSKMSDPERMEVENNLEQQIRSALRSVEKNIYFQVNDKLLGRKIGILNINGNVATEIEESYIDYLKDRVNAFAKPAEDGRVYSLNGYFTFDLPTEQLDKIESKPSSERKLDVLKTITPKVNIVGYRTMDDKSKADAINGVKEAQKRWVEEEIAEFYEAIHQFNNGLYTYSSKGVKKDIATIDDVIDETLGIFRTIQMFPEFSDVIKPYLSDIKIALDTFGRKEGYAIYKAKKDAKGQAKEMTYENLFEVVDRFIKPETKLEDTAINDAVNNTPTNNLPKDDDDLGELTRSRLLRAGASQDDIISAIRWWNSSPLKGLIPLTQMINIVNSDAWATFTKSGITLFSGSDFTDVYHEAWHAFSQLFLTQEQKDKLYQEVKDAGITITEADGTKINSKDATPRQIEEYLAEEFKTFAMSGGKFSKKQAAPKVRKNLFQRIWDFLKNWFNGPISPIEETLSQAYIEPVQKYFDQLYFAGKDPESSDAFKNMYMPHTDITKYYKNVMFGYLGSSPVPLNEQAEETISYDEGMWISSNVDSLVSMWVDAQNLSRADRLATARVFANAKNQESAYKWAKKQLEKKLQELSEQYSKLSDEDKLKYDNQILANDIKVINWAVNNWGDTNAVIKGTEEKGMLSFYRQRSRFKDVMAKVDPRAVQELNDSTTETATTDAEAINKGLRVGDRTGAELSIKEMANNSTLYLVRSLHKVDSKTGKKVLNRLGFPELVDFSEAWNALVRNLAGSLEPMDIYRKLGSLDLFAQKEELKSERDAKLKQATTEQQIDNIRKEYTSKIDIINRQLASKTSFPSFIQLADKLGPPSMTKEGPVFDIWTDFWQDMCKARIPLVQMTNDKFVTKDEETGDITETRYEYSVGRTAADLNRVQFDWLSEFKKQSPETNPFVIQNNNRENMLNLSQVIRSFAVRSKQGDSLVLDETKKIEFLRAIGVYLDDKLEIRAIVNTDSTLEITRLFKAIEHLYNMGVEVYNPIRVLKEGFRYDYTIERNGKKIKYSGSEPSQTSRLEKLASIQARLSDSYSNLSVSTAENKKAYEHYLNNQITVAMDAINRAKNFKEIYDENGETPYMSYMNPEYNPGILSSIWLNSIFILDVPKSDPQYGRKRKESTQVSAEDVKLLLENISGYQMTERGIFFEKGTGSASADRATKVIGDFHMFLDSGILEFMRHASKTASFGARVKKIITYKGKKEDGLYIDTTEFLREASQSQNTKLTDIVLKYLQAEVLRTGIVRNNPEIYKNITGYKNGANLTIFDDILLDPESKAVLSNEFYEDLKANENDILSLLNKPKYTALKYKITQQIGQYFDKVIKDYNEEFLKTEYINPQLMKKVIARTTGDDQLAKELMDDADYKARMRNAMVASFAVNAWIHNVESTFIIYGDVVQFNHDKDEFNKRNASTASNGYLFRTDKSAQDFINMMWGRPMLKKYYDNNPNKVGLDVLNRPYDGTLNTAILKEPVFKSSKYDLINDKFRKYYDDLFKSQGMKKASDRTKAIDKILYGEDGTVDKPTGGVMEPFFKMKVADGQGYVTFDTYRMLRKLEGKWLPAHDTAFQRIINGETLRPDEITKFFPPYKVIHSGFLKTKTLPVNSLHKFSLMPLIPGAIDSDSTLMKLNEKMMEQGIDYVLYESGSKISHITSNGEGDAVYTDMENKVFNDNINFTKNVIYVKNLRNQVDINMEWKGSTIFSTQLRKLAIQGLYNRGVAINKDAEAKAKKYIAIVDQLTELKRKEFLKEAGWTEDEKGELSGSDADLVAMVQDQLRNLGMSDHEIQFIDVDPDTGEVKYDWSAHLSRERLERLVVALVNNRLIKQHMNGEPLVQLSDALFEKVRFTKPTEEQLEQYNARELQSYGEGEDGKTTAMQVKISMQGDFINLFKLNDKNGKQIGIYDKVEKPDGDIDYVLNMKKSLNNLNSLLRDKEWLDMNDNRKKIRMIGVRIPVQGLGQMEFMEIAEFLEPSAGNVIIAPYDIVAKSGADFDIDKMTIFMPKLTSQGQFLDTKYKSEEEIQKEIDKLKDEKTKFLKGIDADISTSELEKKLKGTQKEQYAALRALGSQIALAKEEKKQLIKSMRAELSLVANSKRLDEDQRDIITNGTDDELMDLVKELRKSRKLSKISKAADKLSQDSYELYKKLKGIRDQYKLSEEELAEIKKGNDKVKEFKDKISSLNEQKRNFISVFENRMIDSIVDILSMPENFVNLIRPNGTDLVKYVADELKNFVQERDHSISKKDGSRRAKGVSPTRVFEYTYQLDKHQDNNVGKRSLGIAAQVNTANTISQFIGGHLPSELTYTEVVTEKDDKGVLRKVKKSIKKPVIFHLNHNTMMVDGKEVISLSDIYDAGGITRIADIVSQLMNGFVDVEKDPWVAYVQGNVEVTPNLLALVEAGVPFREAAYFVSNPLVREYVNQQRRIKSTFSGPLGSDIDNPNWFRGEALKKTLNKYNLPELPRQKEARKLAIQELVEKNMPGITKDGKIPMETLERIVAEPNNTIKIKGVETPGLPINSQETYTAFLHYIQIEEYLSGIKALRFKTNVDTKKDATLFDAMLREIEIDALYSNEGTPKQMIDAYLNESVISSFFIQNFLQKLWSKYFPTTNNDAVQQFLVNKLRDYNTREYAQEVTGYDLSKIATEYKNALIPFLFQNYIKSFDLRKSDFYKGMAINEKVPVKYVDALKSGVIVKDVDGKPTIFIDPAQVEKDWQSKIFESPQYAEQGLSQLPAGVFTLKGQESVKEYTNFLLEREYLRNLITQDAAKQDPQYTRILESKRRSTPRNEGEILADFNTRVENLSYEDFLRDKALDNTMNFYKMFYHKTESMGEQLMDIIKSYPHLSTQYPVLKQFATRVGGRGVAGLQDLTNILLRDQRDVDTELANSYYQSLKKLADPSITKVSNTKENERISSLFRALPIFAFMQTGMSKGEFNFTNIVPYDDYMNIMSEPIKLFKQFMEPKVFDPMSDELSALIEEDTEFVARQKANAPAGTSVRVVHKYTFKTNPRNKTVSVYNTAILELLWNKFLKQNSRENISLRNKIQLYTMDFTPKALLDGADTNAQVIRSPYILRMATPGMYRLQSGTYMNLTLDDGTIKRSYVPITVKDVKALAGNNTDTVFFYDTTAELVNAMITKNNPLASKLELERAKSDPFISLRMAPNGAGIRTTVGNIQGYNPTTEEGLNVVKAIIKADIDAAVQKTVGKSVVFPDDGIGQELLRSATTTIATTTDEVKGTIQLELIEDLVQQGKAKTTVRNYDKATGIYKSTKTGMLYNIVNRGKVKKVGDKIVGKNVSYTLDEFGKAEGFDNWENFVKAAKYAGVDIQKGKEVFLYDIEPLKAPKPQAPVSQVTIENSEYRKEIFRYLSQLLYDNFGYINPGSQEIPSIMDVIAREQGVTDQDRENLKNRCSRL